jgi:hypothetical protein
LNILYFAMRQALYNSDVARQSSPTGGKAGRARLSVVQQTADMFARLVDDDVQEKRAAGASPRTVGHYREVLERVLIPFCAERQIKTPAELTPRHLNDLGAGLLDGTGARSGRAISKATVHGYTRAINTFLGWATPRARAARRAANCRLCAGGSGDALTRGGRPHGGRGRDGARQADRPPSRRHRHALG